ncbi:MAG: hypothetical protein LLF89_08510 [Spirochaetaceae bacterium]|nr:hypothetical protein [Spirochaetaceae bacterium]
MKSSAVEIRFGGAARHLIYDFNALAELEDEAGTYRSDVAHLKAVRAALWAGLLSETLDSRGRETAATLSLRQVGEILSEMSEEEINQIVEAIQKARGIADPDPEPNARPTTAAAPRES